MEELGETRQFLVQFDVGGISLSYNWCWEGNSGSIVVAERVNGVMVRRSTAPNKQERTLLVRRADERCFKRSGFSYYCLRNYFFVILNQWGDGLCWIVCYVFYLYPS